MGEKKGVWWNKQNSSLQFQIPGIKVRTRLKFLAKGLTVHCLLQKAGGQADGAGIAPYSSDMADDAGLGFSSVSAF